MLVCNLIELSISLQIIASITEIRVIDVGTPRAKEEIKYFRLCWVVNALYIVVLITTPVSEDPESPDREL